MENINFLETLAQRLGQTATVKNVYGEPVAAGDKTIIPVAQIIYGFGGGYGYGRKPRKFSNPENVSAGNGNEKKVVKALAAEVGYLQGQKGFMKFPNKAQDLSRLTIPVN